MPEGSQLSACKALSKIGMESMLSVSGVCRVSECDLDHQRRQTTSSPEKIPRREQETDYKIDLSPIKEGEETWIEIINESKEPQ